MRVSSGTNQSCGLTKYYYRSTRCRPPLAGWCIVFLEVMIFGMMVGASRRPSARLKIFLVPTLSGRVKLLGLYPAVLGRDIPNRVTATTRDTFSGDYAAGETPLPIPNRADKPRRADGTIRETVWESRSLPGVIENPISIWFGMGFLFHTKASARVSSLPA